MMYKIGTQILRIPQKTKTKAVGTVVQWRDVAETCRCLKALTLYLKDTSPFRIVDGVAGSGFWAAIVKQEWPDVQLWLNETDQNSADLLRQHYLEARITQHSLQEWNPPRADLGILEFHQFTLRTWETQKEVLRRWSQRMGRIILADGACFGFKFGNLQHYGVDSEQEYYQLLNRTIIPVLNGKRITVVSKFSNAALMVIEESKKELQIIPPAVIPLFRNGKKHESTSVPKRNSQGGLWTGGK